MRPIRDMQDHLKLRPSASAPRRKRALYRAFLAGRYAEVLKLWEADNSSHSQDIAFVIGSYSYLGKILEAHALYSKFKTALEVEGRACAVFFLAVTYSRHRQHHKALPLVVENLVRHRRGADSLRAYSFLGAGMYRYCYGRLKPARAHAQRAYVAAVAAADTYLKFVATDLLGHCEINAGDVQQGLTRLRESQAYARELGQGAIAQAAQVTLELYRSTLGLNPAPLPELTHISLSLFFQDAYMAAQVNLERARMLLLGGCPEEARIVLEESRTFAFERGNLRLQTLHQLRLAEYFYHVGETEQCERIAKDSLLRLGEGEPNPDLRLELALRGILAKCQGFTADNLLIALTRKTDGLQARRILFRDYGQRIGTAPLASQDPLGDLMDGLTAKKGHAIAQALREARLGLLHRALSIPPSARAIVFGLEKMSCTLFHRGRVHHLPDGLSSLQREFLEYLAGAPRTEAELAENVWKERFIEGRHERLIASFVSRLRLVSPLLEALCLRSEARFALAAGTLVFTFREPVVGDVLPAKLRSVSSVAGPKDPSLNFRQNALLEAGPEWVGAALSISVYCARFSVSSRTALRDLSEMKEKGWLRVLGSGRATRYQLVAKGLLEEN